MRFLTAGECAEWCRRHGCPAPPAPGAQPFDEGYVAHEFVIPADAGKRVALCRLLWDVVCGAEVTERLLWITEWSVWPSGEHVPLFLRLRSALGETRTLVEAPGHLIGPGDTDDGLSLLVVSALFLWDCWLYAENGAIVALSHDEHGLVLEPDHGVVPARRAALADLGVLMKQ